MPAYLSLVLFLFPSLLIGQNLVVNPGFEHHRPDATVVACQFMDYSANFTAALQDWNAFRGLTPDLHRAAENCSLLTETHGGSFCAGIIHYLPSADIGQRKDYHEVIQGRLRKPLQPGVRYRLEVWVREDPAMMQQHIKEVYAPKSPVKPVQAGNLGFCFLVRPLPSNKAMSWMQREYNLQPQVNFSEVISTNGQWVKLTTTFVPNQPFQFFLIGNFFSDLQTPTNLRPEQDSLISQRNEKMGMPIDRTKRVGYLCLDDVSVTLEPVQEREDTLSLERKLLVRKRVSFSAGVLFDSGEAQLRQEAFPELDQLVQFMLKYPKSRIGIAGHTDDVGTEIDNQGLSESRALAVFHYLQGKGIPETRLDWKAFGESRPVADNTTDAGRQQNRRVECLLLR